MDICLAVCWKQRASQIHEQLRAWFSGLYHWALGKEIQLPLMTRSFLVAMEKLALGKMVQLSQRVVREQQHVLILACPR